MQIHVTDATHRGFPADIILPMTVMSRTQGLMAHWKEAMGKCSEHGVGIISNTDVI